jgi:alanine racemase
MARLGLSPSKLGTFITQFKAMQGVELEGVFSHLASAEVLDAEDAQQQEQRFARALQQIEAHELRPFYRHLANSSATLGRPSTWYNFVRPGMALYGYELPLVHRDGSAVANYQSLGLIPAMSWKTRVLSVREVSAGQPLGYSSAYVMASDGRIAVIAAGYGDGLYRRLSPGGYVLLNGQRAPLLGRISMDLTIVDVTHIPQAQIGDEVVLIGASGSEQITAVDHARWSGTIPYEILCNLSERVARRHLQ